MLREPPGSGSPRRGVRYWRANNRCRRRVDRPQTFGQPGQRLVFDQILLRDQQPVGDRGLLDRFELRVELQDTVDPVDGRDHAVEPGRVTAALAAAFAELVAEDIAAQAPPRS